jgi:hypothetical protein
MIKKRINQNNAQILLNKNDIMKVLFSKDKPLTKNIVIDLEKEELTIPLGKGSKLKFGPEGLITFMLNGKFHREDGPALISYRTQEWYLHGQHHRLDGPAVEAYEDKEWWINGKRHREDGPAKECENGDQEWYLDGKLHRTDGPAIIDTDGDKSWYIHGSLHREDGPAMELSNGTKKWFLNGKRINSEKEYLKLLKLKTLW